MATAQARDQPRLSKTTTGQRPPLLVPPHPRLPRRHSTRSPNTGTVPKLRHWKPEIRKMHKYLKEHKLVDKNNMVRADFTAQYIWQHAGRNSDFENRHKWLVAAGWDPAGWIFHNWHQLPRNLKLDFCLVGLDNIMAITADKEWRSPYNGRSA